MPLNTGLLTHQHLERDLGRILTLYRFGLGLEICTALGVLRDQEPSPRLSE